MVYGCGRCRYSPAGCSNCKNPDYKPTAACLAKRAEAGGKPLPRPRSGKSPGKSPAAAKPRSGRKPAAPSIPPERSSARRKAKKDATGEYYMVRANCSSSSEDSGANISDSDDGGAAAGGRAAGGAVMPAAPGGLRYSYCSGANPLAAAHGLNDMRTSIEVLGRVFDDDWLCSVTETNGVKTDLCYSHASPAGDRRISCRSVDEVLALLDALDTAKKPQGGAKPQLAAPKKPTAAAAAAPTEVPEAGDAVLPKKKRGRGGKADSAAAAEAAEGAAAARGADQSEASGDAKRQKTGDADDVTLADAPPVEGDTLQNRLRQAGAGRSHPPSPDAASPAVADGALAAGDAPPQDASVGAGGPSADAGEASSPLRDQQGPSGFTAAADAAKDAAAAAAQEDSLGAGFSGASDLSIGGAASPSDGAASAAFMSKLQERMQQVRSERAAAPPPEALSSGRASHGRRLSLAGGLAVSGDPRVAVFEPPASPFGLIEEQLYSEPWKLLAACLLLNKTTASAVRKVIWALFELCPTPEAAVAAELAKISELIDCLGFYKRAAAFQRFSRDYLQKQWTNPEELYGIGKYGADAYFMFCRGEWRRVQPKDKDLLKYKIWLEETDGQGQGLTRDLLPGADALAVAAKADAAAPGTKNGAAAPEAAAAAAMAVVAASQEQPVERAAVGAAE